MSALLPCPFCGGEAIVEITHAFGVGTPVLASAAATMPKPLVITTPESVTPEAVRTRHRDGDSGEHEMTIKPEAQAEIENFRDRLAKRGAAVQVARDAVVRRARELKAANDRWTHAPNGPDFDDARLKRGEAVASVCIAMAELDRQEARLKGGEE